MAPQGSARSPYLEGKRTKQASQTAQVKAQWLSLLAAAAARNIWGSLCSSPERPRVLCWLGRGVWRASGAGRTGDVMRWLAAKEHGGYGELSSGSSLPVSLSHVAAVQDNDDWMEGSPAFRNAPPPVRMLLACLCPVECVFPVPHPGRLGCLMTATWVHWRNDGLYRVGLNWNASCEVG